MLKHVMTSIWWMALSVALISCSHKGDPNPVAFPQAPPPATDPSPNGTASESLPKEKKEEAAVSYSDFMRIQQSVWLRDGHLTSDAGVRGKRSYGSTYQSSICAKGVKCQNGTVRVFLNSERGVSACTGVLVAANVVLTNRHCVESVVTSANQSFSGGNILVVVPSTNTKSFNETSSVVNVIGLSPKGYQVGQLAPDYAFLLLANPIKSVRPARMNFGGIRDGETYTVFSISPYEKKNSDYREVIESWSCVSRYGTVAASQLTGPYEPIFTFANCDIGPSNSGSPLFNKDGELVGLIAGQMNPMLVEVLNDLGAEFGIVRPFNPLTNVGWGTNLACIPDINNLTKQILPACNNAFQQPRPEAKVPEHLESRAMAMVNSAPQENPQQFRYRVQKANGRGQSVMDYLGQVLYVRVPECVKKEALPNLPSNEVSVEIAMAGVILNSSWVLTDQVSDVKVLKLTAHLNLAALKQGRSDMTIQLGKLVIHRADLRVCD